MGTDINLVVETRSPNGRWSLAPSPLGPDGAWFDDRVYECFTLLTGLDFCMRSIQPSTPVADVRGWPDDLSEEGRRVLTSWNDDTAFGHSWLSTADFDSFDWEAAVEWLYMASPPSGWEHSQAVVDAVRRHAREHGRPPKGWGVAGWSRDGFDVVGTMSRRSFAESFLTRVVEPMRNLSPLDPHSARCVFSFVR